MSVPQHYDAFVPTEYICPYTCTTMKDPIFITCPNGHKMTVDRRVLYSETGCATCPIDKVQIASARSLPMLQRLIWQWETEHCLQPIRPSDLARWILFPKDPPIIETIEQLGACMRFLQTAGTINETIHSLANLACAEKVRIPEPNAIPNSLDPLSALLFHHILTEAQQEVGNWQKQRSPSYQEAAPIQQQSSSSRQEQRHEPFRRGFLSEAKPSYAALPSSSDADSVVSSWLAESPFQDGSQMEVVPTFSEVPHPPRLSQSYKVWPFS